MRLLRRIAPPVLMLLVPNAFAAPATPTSVRSAVDGIHAVAATVLPAPRQPTTFEPGHFCRNGRVDPPKTAAGRQAAALGWSVTSEERSTGYTAIGVFSRGSEGTSGTCFIEDGNIVIYRDAQPVAIVYGDAPAKDEGGVIGGVVPTLTPDRLRISDWTPAGLEHADIVFAPDRIDVVAIAARETVCGDITLPNLRGKSIPAARQLLAPFGWSPAVFGRRPSADDAPYDAARTYRKQGLTEFETCSGTGYGFCSVRYIHRGGARLEVTTVGDDPPEVSGYAVACAAPTARQRRGSALP